MGHYLNPDNASFKELADTKTYRDKSLLIKHINSIIDTKKNMVCCSFPELTGKTALMNMLVTYYGKSYSSSPFNMLQISKTNEYTSHLNIYNVIHIQLKTVLEGNLKNDLLNLEHNIKEELFESYSGIRFSDSDSIGIIITKISKRNNNRMMLFIDDWDLPFRKDFNNDEQKQYIDFLLDLMPENYAELYSLVYLCGIIPLGLTKLKNKYKRIKDFSIFNPGPYANYIGFNDEDVNAIGDFYGRYYLNTVDSFFKISGKSVYSPIDVYNSFRWGYKTSFWSHSVNLESVKSIIQNSSELIKEKLIKMISGFRLSFEDLGTHYSLTSPKGIVLYLICNGLLVYENGTYYIGNEQAKKLIISVLPKEELKDYLNRNKIPDMYFDMLIDDRDRIEAYFSALKNSRSFSNDLYEKILLSNYNTCQYYRLPEAEMYDKRIDVFYYPDNLYVDSKPLYIVSGEFDEEADDLSVDNIKNHYPEYDGKVLLIKLRFYKNGCTVKIENYVINSIKNN